MVIQGVIRPPPEIRAVADRTASYVAKNGRAFETRILSSSKGKTPKFAFLQPTNPFHAYYQDRIQFYENGGQDDDENENNDDSKKKKDKEEGSNDKVAANGDKEGATTTENKQNIQSKATHSAIDPVAKALLTHRTQIAKLKASSNKQQQQDATTNDNATEVANTQGETPPTIVIPSPPPLNFIHIIPPASLTVVQIETIQLVAQLTALDGKGGTFLSTLTRREWNNPLYAFCQPRHGHFAYFSALVDAYRHVITTWTSTSMETAKQSDGENQQMGVVSADIKQMSNNPQTCLQVAAYRAEYNRYLAAERQRRANANTPDISAAALIDWHDFVVVETIDFARDEQVVTLPPPPPVNIQPQQQQASTASKNDEMEDSDEEDKDAEQIRVVPTYQPKVVSAAQSSTLETVIDPLTGKRVRVADIPEHMRIKFLDPKWAEERKRFQDKQKDSNLVGGDVVASNLARFAQAKGISNKDVLDTEGDSKKRLQDANRLLREHALDPKTKVGPALPQAEPKRPAPEANTAQQPEAKRPRVTEVLPPPPPPPVNVAPPGYTGFGATPTVDPFAAAASGAGTPTGATAVSAPASGTMAPTQSEADFMASLPRPEVTLQVRVPNDPAQMAWNFYGQIVPLSVHAMTNIKSVKQELSRQHLNQMPVNKIQLKMATTGAFLNNNSATLAALNLGPTATLELLPKTRGGRK